MIKKYKTVQNIFRFNRFIKYGFLLTALQITSGFLGYIYQILVGRMLSPSEFALFSAVMALFMFCSAPMAAFSMVMVRKVSTLRAYERIENIHSMYWRLKKYLLGLTTALLIIFLCGNQFLTTYLRAPDKSTAIYFSFIVVLSLFSSINLSFYQGLQKFLSLGLLGITTVVLKILISLLLINIGMGISGALFGVMISILLVYVVGMIPFARVYQKLQHKSYSKINIKSLTESFPILLATISLTAMTQLDMVLVNWFFNPEEAGLYAAASVLGKAVLYLPGGLVVALFPIVAERHAKGGKSLSLFLQASIVTLCSCGLIAFIYWLFGEEIIQFLYGESYIGAGKILSWYGFAILPISIVIVAEQFLIAKGKVLFAWLFLGIVPFQFLAIYNWHSELWMILAVMCVFGLILVLIGFWLIFRDFNNNKII
jgi:O-antigen/teichoic acid export membrane protein